VDYTTVDKADAELRYSPPMPQKIWTAEELDKKTRLILVSQNAIQHARHGAVLT